MGNAEVEATQRGADLEASAPSYTDAGGEHRGSPPLPVALRVELASKRYAQFTQYSMWLFILGLFVLAIVFLCLQNSMLGGGKEPRSHTFHLVILIVASVVLGILLAVGGVFIVRTVRSVRNNLIWTRRHRALAIDGAVVLALSVVSNACWVAPNALVVASACIWPTKAVGVLAIFRDTCFNTLMMWMIVMISSFSRYHPPKGSAWTPAREPSMVPPSGKGPSPEFKKLAGPPSTSGTAAGPGAGAASGGEAADAAAGHLLWIDRPWGEQLRHHALKLVILLILEVPVLLNGIKQITWAGTDFYLQEPPACPGAPTFASISGCKVKNVARVSLLIQALIAICFFVAYIMYQRKAYKDHLSLPYTKYRMSNLYIRVQFRHGTTTLGALVLTLVVSRIAGSTGNCWAYLETQLGYLPVQLGLFLMGMVSALLYMPVGGMGASVLQSWLQEFCWSEAHLDTARKTRSKELQRLAAAESPGSGAAAIQDLLHTLAPHLVQSRGVAVAEAAAALADEPMMCVETCLRLFYWSRLAYRCTIKDPFVTANTALSLFGLQHSEIIQEPTTETLAVVGWGGPGCPRIVVSFRGTANMQNVMTDIKFWKVIHEPRRWRHGRLVLVHSGFYNAFMAAGFSQRLLARLEEISSGLQVDRAQLQFSVTGHSLGGALATLGAHAIRTAYPDALITCYTFGSPRVGNSAWTNEYNEMVPDHFGIVNHNDPVPRIPKGFYKRSGQRVTINGNGDIVVRPSFFELSVINKSGGTVSDHMNGTYAMALGTILKSQFSDVKGLPGGARGVRALCASLDVGAVLVLHNCDLDSLQDPNCLPLPMEGPVGKKSKKGSRRRFSLTGCCGGSDGGAAMMEDASEEKVEGGAQGDAQYQQDTPGAGATNATLGVRSE